jgi:hypothetical protein
MQHESHRRAGRLLALVTGFDSAGWARENDVRHGIWFSIWLPFRALPGSEHSTRV